MQKAEDALTNTACVGEGELNVECNSLLSVDIDKEIATIHNLIRDKYRSKFPELESLVHDPIDYARLVKKIGNGTDLSLVDLQGLVAPAILIAVSVTATSTGKRPLSEQELQETIDACDRVVALDCAKIRLLEVIERQMGCIAPNLSGVVGAGVAARLMAAAGGLSALVNVPACDVQLLGAKRTALAGFSSRLGLGVGVGDGYLQQTDIFRTTPSSLRIRAWRLLAAKSTLASRVDFLKADPTGNTGKRMRQEIVNKIDKWQEPPPARHPKPLRLPDSQPRKKRGGIRLQKAKRRYGLTEMRKLANRMAFGVPEDSSLGDGYGKGHGMLTSKLRVKVANKFKKKSCQYAAAAAAASTLAFTPVQGIELCNPQPLGATATHHTYFSQTAAFSKINTTT
ncbi:hypothetical protein OROMI_024098 [Orobanche minor]